MNRSTHRVMFVLAALGCVGAAGLSCKQQIDSDKVETGIREHVEGQWPGVVDTVSCPDGVQLKQGDKFDCTVGFKGGGTMTMAVTQDDDRGTVRWIATRSSVLPLKLVVESIQKRMVEKLGGGVAVTVDCGTTLLLGGSAGATFECTATAPDEDPLALTVTQRDDQMNFSWKPKADEAGLAEVVQGAMGQTPPPSPRP